VFSETKRLTERLDALDDVARSITYSGVNYGFWTAGSEPYKLECSPFPGAFVDYTSTVRVWPVTVSSAAAPAAFMEWSGEVFTEPGAAADMKAFLEAFYEGNISILNAFFAEQHSSR
jgi:hypothetical protein